MDKDILLVLILNRRIFKRRKIYVESIQIIAERSPIICWSILDSH